MDDLSDEDLADLMELADGNPSWSIWRILFWWVWF